VKSNAGDQADKATEADEEVLLRVAALRTNAEALVTGRLMPTVPVLEAMEDLASSAAWWARRAAA
jgi:hypothetical protein